jgi:general secretion pathway protein D
MPGTNPTEIQDSGVDDTSGTSSAGIGMKGGGDDSGGGDTSGGGLGSGSLALNQSGQGNGAVTLEVGGDKVGVSAVDETNTLLVRSTGAAWRSIKDVIERLDVMPLQVHIEAQVAEVNLTGDLQYGVSWYFENAIPALAGSTAAELHDRAINRTIWGDLAGSITPVSALGTGGLAWTFLGRNAAAVISALDQVTDVQLLQTPSVVVRNNSVATFNVGSRIPISSVTVNPGTGNGETTYSQVQYLDTGTILKVRPRITKEGMVFLDIVQEVSTPGSVPDRNGNVRINTRRLKTQAAIQSGETIMLAGLIQDGVNRSASGVPGLSRIPIIGSLFGTQASGKSRNEVIVLLTPTVIRNPQDARDLTDEYGRRFRALEPLNRAPRRR